MPQDFFGNLTPDQYGRVYLKWGSKELDIQPEARLKTGHKTRAKVIRRSGLEDQFPLQSMVTVYPRTDGYIEVE